MKGKMEKKTMKILEGDRTVQKNVSDLGIAAYLKMNGFKFVSRRGKNIYFEVSEKDQHNFEDTIFEYLNSPFHEFDACLMALKKIGEYDPKK